MMAQAWAQYIVTQTWAQTSIDKARMLNSRNYCMTQTRTTNQTCAYELAPLQEWLIIAERAIFEHFRVCFHRGILMKMDPPRAHQSIGFNGLLIRFYTIL